MTLKKNGYYYELCSYCGRTWWMIGGRTVGFVVAGAKVHIDYCRTRKPAERRKRNVVDERRWEKSPPRTAQIVNPLDHPGLRD